MAKERQAEGPPYQQHLPLDVPEQPSKHPGQLSFVDWLKHPDVVYHGSHRADWEQGFEAHVGTREAASDRLLQVASNTAPNSKPGEWPERRPHPTDMPEGGRLYARRLTEPVAMTTTRDSTLNWGQQKARTDPEKLYQEADLPGLQREESEEIKAAGRHIREGRPVAYPNAYEDIGSRSVLAPRGTLRAWHQDVAEARSMGLDVHPHDIPIAESQFDPAISVAPRSMGHAVETFVKHRQGGREPRQLSMFPASAGDKLFEIRPEDRDWTGWQREPGSDARQRAHDYAINVLGNVKEFGFGVHPQWEPAEMPEDVYRVPRLRKDL